MNKMTWYAVIAAVWIAFLMVIGVNLLGNTVMFGSPLPHEEAHMEKFGYPIEVVEEAPTDAVGEAGGLVTSLHLIAAASVEDGARVFKKCAPCHTAEAGGATKTGPNLHNIVGAEVANHAGFKTTESLNSIGGSWDYAKLDDYLENPKRLAPKGSMSLAGLKKPADRAAVIKFLASQTDSPPPFPAAEAPDAPAAAPAEAAPAPASTAPAAK